MLCPLKQSTEEELWGTLQLFLAFQTRITWPNNISCRWTLGIQIKSLILGHSFYKDIY